MSRINPSCRRVVVTGVGFREQVEAHSADNIFRSSGVKPNMGSAIALEAARAGYAVVLTARTTSKLERACSSIREIVPSTEIVSFPADLQMPSSIQKLAEELPSDRELDLVHCAGLSAESFNRSDENLFFSVSETPIDLPMIEFEAVVKSLLVLVQAFLPRLRTQSHSRLVVVTSMSGIRAIPFGYSHSAAKAGLHQGVRSLALELNPLGIRVCEILPGIVNTGFYDSPSVDAAVRGMGPTFGYTYSSGQLPQMKPDAVAEAAVLCLTSNAHILSIAMVADGQFPHHGA